MFEAVGFQGVVWRKPHVTFLDFPPFGLNTKKRTSLNSDILVLQPKLLHPESQILVLPTVAGARLWVAEATTGDPKFYTVSSVQG